MKNKIIKSLVAGIIATAAMTIIMYVAPFMGLPKMNPAEMLSSMMNIPQLLGWIMHFMIGIVFGIAYSFLLIKPFRKITNAITKGFIFGMIVFVFAQINMALMGMMLNIPSIEGDMLLMMVGSIIGHVVFGIVISLLIKE